MNTSATSAASATSAKKRKRVRRNGIRKHGAGYQARFQVKGTTEAQTFPTRAEAELWLKLMRDQLIDDAGGGYELARKMTMADLLQEYAEKEAKGHKGASQELSRVACLAKLEWAQTRLLDLLPADVDALMKSFEKQGPGGKPLKNDTRRLYFSAISCSFKYAIEKLKWHFLANPCSAASRPPPGKGRKRVLTADEENRLVARLRVSPNPLYAHAMLLLIATTMRMGELFTLQWQHVDLENRRVYLQEDKANGIEGREVPLSVEGVMLFEDLPRVNKMVVPFQRSAFEEIWKQARIDLSIDDLRLQDLRHDGATRWAKRLNNVALLQNVTGHKTLAMVQRYVNVPLQDTINAMDAAMADDPFLRDRPRIKPKVRYSLVQHIRPLPGADVKSASDATSPAWEQKRGERGRFAVAYTTPGKK